MRDNAADLSDPEADGVVSSFPHSIHLPQGRRLSDELEDELDRYRQLLDRVQAIVWRGNAQTFKFTFVSPYAETLLGYPVERWLNEPAFWKDHIHPEDRDWAVHFCAEATSERRPHEFDYRMIAADGRIVWLHDVVYVLMEEGQPTELIGIMIDITEKKRAEEALRRGEDQLRKVVDVIPQQIWSGPADGSLDFCNDRWRSEMGLSLEELQDDGWQRMLHPDDRKQVLEAWQESVRSGTPYEQEERHRMRDGQYRWFLCRGVPLRDSEGRILRWYGTNTDIDDQRQAEEAARNSEQRFHQLVDMIPAAVYTCDLSGRVTYYNRRAVELWGREPKGSDVERFCGSFRLYQLDGTPLPHDQSPMAEAIRTSNAPLPNLEVVIERPDRSRIVAMVNIAVLADQEGKPMGALNCFQDITDRKRTEVELQKAFQQIQVLKDQLYHENLVLREEVNSSSMFGEIIAQSTALNDALRQVEAVAPTESTVMITGETGTGKELIARAIHDHSPRRGHSFVKIDCAAIPAALMESELFGHEKGAFTGATAQKLGRFELADHGTVFLDEVGDVPLELQPKLLRVLQDHAFEKLGSTRTRRVDVRVIAATHRDLEKMVEEGAFREDLYYRLKVFPLVIPPLRDRSSDIELLVKYYVAKYAQRMKKEVPAVPHCTMEVFLQYPWPGNVRELQHFIERSVVLTSGRQLQAPISELQQYIRRRAGKLTANPSKLEDIERESILQALEQSNWIVGGPHGAAVKLGLKRTTLASRMEKLGISRPRRQNILRNTRQVG